MSRPNAHTAFRLPLKDLNELRDIAVDEGVSVSKLLCIGVQLVIGLYRDRAVAVPASAPPDSDAYAEEVR